MNSLIKIGQVCWRLAGDSMMTALLAKAALLHTLDNVAMAGLD
jgi:hypothetical protein